jgi:hypothetical protein
MFVLKKTPANANRERRDELAIMDPPRRNPPPRRRSLR